jgi:hypothetical protein
MVYLFLIDSIILYIIVLLLYFPPHNLFWACGLWPATSYLRHYLRVQGVTIGDTTHRITQFADDTQLINPTLTA